MNKEQTQNKIQNKQAKASLGKFETKSKNNNCSVNKQLRKAKLPTYQINHKTNKTQLKDVQSVRNHCKKKYADIPYRNQNLLQKKSPSSKAKENKEENPKDKPERIA